MAPDLEQLLARAGNDPPAGFAIAGEHCPGMEGMHGEPATRIAKAMITCAVHMSTKFGMRIDDEHLERHGMHAISVVALSTNLQATAMLLPVYPARTRGGGYVLLRSEAKIKVLLQRTFPGVSMKDVVLYAARFKDMDVIALIPEGCLSNSLLYKLGVVDDVSLVPVRLCDGGDGGGDGSRPPVISRVNFHALCTPM